MFIWVRIPLVYSGTSDSGHSEERTTSLQRTSCVPPANNCMHVRTSEEGTTSEKWTKHSSPTCPLFSKYFLEHTHTHTHTHLSYQSEVVADENQPSLEAVDGVSQSVDGLHVEVIGGFVQQK